MICIHSIWMILNCDEGKMNKVPMTVIGKTNLEEELLHLKAVERKNVIIAIAEARAHGDLSENAEYSAAKEKTIVYRRKNSRS